MTGRIARKYFLGQGVPRLGCAQAVAEALKERFGLTEEMVDAMSLARGGKAPGGYCGAVHAALEVAALKAPERRADIEAFFRNEAGGLTCREIRTAHKLMCADCVEKAADLLA
jgi:hypothetical protein